MSMVSRVIPVLTLLVVPLAPSPFPPWRVAGVSNASEFALVSGADSSSAANFRADIRDQPLLCSATEDPPPSTPSPSNLKAALDDMRSDDQDRIDRGAQALEKWGPRAAPAVAELAEILDQDRPASRRHALAVLRAIGPAASPAVPAIRRKLVHDDFHTQYWACRALGAVGPAAKDASEDLRQLLKRDVVASVRRNAAMALGQIGPGIGAESIESLILSLRDWSQPVRVEAALALGNLGKASTAALPELRLALADTRRSMKPASAVALWRITRKAEPLLPVLVRELSEGDLPSEAAAAFAAFGADAAPAVPSLMELLDSDNPETQMSAMEALGHIGPAATAAREKIVQLTRYPEEEIAEVAKATLEKITPSDPPKAADGAKPQK